MSVTKVLIAVAAVAMLVAVQACDRDITRVEKVDQAVACGECHDSGDQITGKQTQWAESAHGMGESYLRGTSAGCAGCHSGDAFVEYVAQMGLNAGSLPAGDPDPTRQDCRTCHMIHETFTGRDWALWTTEPVEFYAAPGVTFDGGAGNLCTNCHQPRRIFPEPQDGVVSGISTHWGPHHGPQSAMLLGMAGAGVSGSVSPHYGATENTCVTCHLGGEVDHTFEAQLSACQKCHPTATSFDYEDIQTDIADLSDQLGELLLAAGLINENSPDGHPTVSSAPTDQAVALWNWLYVAHEDQSHGVHNPDYARALLEEGIARMSAAAQASSE